MAATKLAEGDTTKWCLWRRIGNFECAGNGDEVWWRAVLGRTDFLGRKDAPFVEVGKYMKSVIENVTEETFAQVGGLGKNTEWELLHAVLVFGALCESMQTVSETGSRLLYQPKKLRHVCAWFHLVSIVFPCLISQLVRLAGMRKKAVADCDTFLCAMKPGNRRVRRKIGRCWFGN